MADKGVCWRFRDYGNESMVSPAKRGHEVAFETRLDFLRVRPPSVWQRPYIGTLRKECKGLFEIRLEVGNVQHRPIGYYPGELQFTILAFATERDSKLVPAGVCALAKRRRALIEQNRRYAREFKIEG